MNMKKGNYYINNALSIGYISFDMYGCTVHNKIINKSSIKNTFKIIITSPQ